ncbi:hypothetical protein P8605_36825, partial [Streptomyces sp. T-3]|nr:hypothetical protein [Streptomyces sp. T-3]
ALLGPGLLDRGDRDMAASPAASSQSAGSSKTPAPSGKQVLQTFKSLLPQGKFSEEQARGARDESGPFASVVYDDGHGKAAMGISFSRIDPGGDSAREMVTCPDQTEIEYDFCASKELPDGSQLMLFKGYEYPDRREDTKTWRATLVRADGYLVDMSEWNAPAQKGAPVSRPTPPLSLDQLRSVVTAKEWQSTLRAIPKDPEGALKQGGSPGQTEAPPAADNTQVSSTLAGLLPKGLKITGRGGEGEWAYLVVDDGKGKSYVQVNVQPNMDDVRDELFSGARELPDGTVYTTRQGPGEKGLAGVEMWTADALRPDGLRVVISAFNAADQETAPTRKHPALTLKQLTGMATSKAWLKVGA